MPEYQNQTGTDRDGNPIYGPTMWYKRKEPKKNTANTRNRRRAVGGNNPYDPMAGFRHLPMAVDVGKLLIKQKKKK